jgi:hypothetical protein
MKLASQALTLFMTNNWTKAQACGLIANIEAESGFDPHAIGDGGLAYGICQWHPDRQADFRARFNRCIRDADYVTQLEFVVFELNNKERSAGDALRETDSAAAAGEVVCSRYERPRDRDGNVRRSRGARAEDWFRALP